MKSALEKYYDRLGNVVLRDKQGNPSVFVRHVKQNSSDFDPILPEHTHPAFVVGDVEDDAVYIGKYLTTRLNENGPLYSLPNARVALDVDWSDWNGSNNKLPSNDYGISVMTIYDFGLLCLTMHKLGVKEFHTGTPGLGSNPEDGPAWVGGTLYKVDDLVTFRGDLYKCIKQHTAVIRTTYPSEYPQYWTKIKHVGGTVGDLWTNETSTIPTSQPAYGTMRSWLTGSGPINWYLNSDIWREVDVTNQIGVRGIRIVNGEIQLMPNEYAIDPSIDMETTNTWRAILPHQNDSGHDLVTPGTEGTVHFCVKNGANYFMARELADSEFSNSLSTAGTIPVIDSETLPIVPAILYETALLPLPNSQIRYSMRLRARKNVTSYFIVFRDNSYFPSTSIDSNTIQACEETTKNNITKRTTRLRAREIASV